MQTNTEHQPHQTPPLYEEMATSEAPPAPKQGGSKKTEPVEQPEPTPTLGVIYTENGQRYLRVALDDEPLDGALQFAEQAGEDLPASLAALVRGDVTERQAKRKKLQEAVRAHETKLFKEAARQFAAAPQRRASSAGRKKVEQEEKKGATPAA